MNILLTPFSMEDNLALKDVKNALESKDLKKMAEGNDQSNAEGLVVKGKSNKKNNKQKMLYLMKSQCYGQK